MKLSRTKALEIPPERLNEMQERLKRNSKVMPNGCWEWQLSTYGPGYGTTSFGSHHRGPAHKFSYAAFKGPVSAGLVIMHKCDNPPCINPAHLEMLPQYTNAMDCVKKGRYWSKARKSNPDLVRSPVCRKRGHPMTPDNLKMFKDGRRQCKTCHRMMATLRAKRIRAAARLTRAQQASGREG